MCGRYSQAADLKTLKRRFGLEGEVALKPRYNLAPSQEGPVVVGNSPRRLKLMRWGLVPSWAEGPSLGPRLINARAETLAERPAFHRAFQSRRCLVLADGFYEWRKEKGAKVPMRFVLRNREPFAFAGLWETWKDPQGPELQSFTIVTTGANELLKPVHDRMPAILRPEQEALWLDAGFNDTRALSRLLAPYPPEEMEGYAVSPLVNSPRNDLQRCLEPA